MPYIIALLWSSLLRISARYAEVIPDDVNREHLVLTIEPEQTVRAKCRRIRIPEIQALEAALMQKHWHAWIDTKVAALGNRTPRQAARRRKAASGLEALLSDFARSAEQRSSVFQPDLGDLRRRLGLV